jgi:hypothetical protein
VIVVALLGALTIAGIAATAVAVSSDGYRRIPDRHRDASADSRDR